VQRVLPDLVVAQQTIHWIATESIKDLDSGHSHALDLVHTSSLRRIVERLDGNINLNLSVHEHSFEIGMSLISTESRRQRANAAQQVHAAHLSPGAGEVVDDSSFALENPQMEYP